MKLETKVLKIKESPSRCWDAIVMLARAIDKDRKDAKEINEIIQKQMTNIGEMCKVFYKWHNSHKNSEKAHIEVLKGLCEDLRKYPLHTHY